MVIDVLGRTIAIEAPASALDQLRRLLADLTVARTPVSELRLEPEGRRTLRLLEDGIVVRSEIPAVVGTATVVWWLNSIAVTRAPHIIVHAACVGDRGAVILPGGSGAGKSTLAAACLSDGIAYLSDEYAALDRHTGTIAPYPRPIELETGLVAASTLGAAVGRDSLAPAGIVFPRYARDGSSSMTCLEPRAIFLALVSHATNLGRLRGDAVPWLAALSLACPGWEATYHDARDAVSLVRDLARRPGEVIEPAPVIGPITATTTTVAIDEDIAVFEATTGRVHLLNASAGLIWLSVPDLDLEPSRLVEVVVQRARSANIDHATIKQTVQQFATAGLLPKRRP